MRRYQRGFTVIELMITLVVMGIVFAIVAPNFNQQIQNNRTVSLAEELVGAINYARAEALRRGGYVSVCASSNGTSCTGGDWGDGVIVAADGAANDTADPTGLTVLRVWPDFGDRAEISEANSKEFIRYLGSGRMALVDNNAFVMTVKYEGCNGDDAGRTVTVGVSGMVSVERSACP